MTIKTDCIADETKKQIDHWLTKYPADQKRSASVAALRLVQEQNGGYLTNALVEAVAAYLELPTIVAFEVASFYDMLELHPVGKFKITVCTNVSCMLRGSQGIVDHLEKRLGVGLGETTADGLFTIKEAECMGACANAPMCQVNNKKYYEDLTLEKVDALLDQLKQEAA